MTPRPAIARLQSFLRVERYITPISQCSPFKYPPFKVSDSPIPCASTMLLAAKVALVFNTIWAALLQYFTSIPFEGVFRVLIMLGCIPMYIKEMRRLKDLLDVISPRQRALSFRRFVREYAAGSDYRNIICGCVLIAASVTWVAESQQICVTNDLTFPKAFLVIAVTYALCGLGLSNLYTRGLWTVALSRSRAELWTQYAAYSLANKYINISVVLATPEAWTKGAVIFFISSQIASTFRLDEHEDVGEGGWRLLQYSTLLVGTLIVCYSLLVARIFRRLVSMSKNSDSDATPRWARDTRSGPQPIAPQ